MPYIKVNTSQIELLREEVKKAETVVRDVSSVVADVKRRLDWKVSSKSNIDSTLSKISRKLSDNSGRFQNTANFLDYTLSEYLEVEKDSSSNPSFLFEMNHFSKYNNYQVIGENNTSIDVENSIEKRQKTAKTWKWIVGGLCAVASIAAIVATGGTAAPLILGGVSAVTGAVMAGTSNLAEVYIEKGDIWDADWGEFGKDVLVGGCVGWLTGIIGGSVGNVVTGKLSQTALQSGLYSTNTMIRVGTNAVIGGVSEVSSGVVSRGTGALIEGAMEGDIDVGEITDQAFDLNNVIYDMAVGGVTSGLSGLKEPSFAEGMPKADANRYIEKTGGFASEMSDVDAVRYIQRQSGNYNTYNTELTVADPNFVNQNAYDPNYGKIKWEKYTPNGGAVEGSVKHNQTIKKGTKIVRYGDGMGKFVAPEGTTFEQCSLPYKKNPKAMHTYIVKKTIKNVTVSEVAPGFNQLGGGTQYELADTVYDLMFKKGALIEVN